MQNKINDRVGSQLHSFMIANNAETEKQGEGGKNSTLHDMKHLNEETLEKKLS